MQAHHEHEFEATPGLPEALPPGEHILWQGRPDWRRLAQDAFHLRRIAAYFVLMLGLQAALSWQPADGLPANLAPLALSAAFAGVALALLALAAWLSAQTTMYTLTNKRVVMRIGIVLTVSFNLPLRWIAAAHLHANADGSGDVALELKGGDRIAYLHLWPHARAWYLKKPQPLLRCVPGVAELGSRLHHAWQQRRAEIGEIAPQERIPVRMPAAAMAR